MKLKKYLCLFMFLITVALSGCSISTNKNSTTVFNDDFTYLGYVKSNVIDEGKVHIGIKYNCIYNLNSVTVYASFLENNNIIYNTEKTSNVIYPANSEGTIYLDVDYETVFLSFDDVIISFKGITVDNVNEINNAKKEYKITLNFNSAAHQNKILKIKNGEKIKYSDIPTSENKTFIGWYSDYELTNPYDIQNNIPTDDLTLYAKWQINYDSLNNAIESTAIKSDVTIHNKQYNSFLGIRTSSKTNLGSGIIFKRIGSTYYVLTNNHVVYFNGKYKKQKITITDFDGKKYTAKIVGNDAKYDLAILSFNTTKNLTVTQLADSNPEINEEIIAIGHPKGHSDTVTYGKILEYKEIEMFDDNANKSDVDFPVILHSANTAKGSSGCAILNANLNIVAIHFAGAENENGEFLYGAAIPLDKIKEFMDFYF